jgi:hypothetical protein
MSVELSFAGWCEVRLATNPDPFDETRGVSGWTFALPGEPDLDRIIRFQPAGAVKRWLSPDIGVAVRSVAIGGAAQAGHALVGAEVRLLDNPVFEGRNGVVAGDAEEPILPFHIAVVGAGASYRRAMLHPQTGQPELVKSIGADEKPAELANAGVASAAAHRAQRLQQIEQRLATEPSPQIKAGLRKRKKWFDDSGPGRALMWGPVPAPVFVNYDYQLRGAAGSVDDPGSMLPAIDTSTPWRVRLSFGVWDADTLCAYVTGMLTLPT